MPFDNNEMFKEMLKSGNLITDRNYTKIHLKVSKFDSPANLPNVSTVLERCGNHPVNVAERQQQERPKIPAENVVVVIV